MIKKIASTFVIKCAPIMLEREREMVIYGVVKIQAQKKFSDLHLVQSLVNQRRKGLLMILMMLLG